MTLTGPSGGVWLMFAERQLPEMCSDWGAVLLLRYCAGLVSTTWADSSHPELRQAPLLLRLPNPLPPKGPLSLKPTWAPLAKLSPQTWTCLGAPRGTANASPETFQDSAKPDLLRSQCSAIVQQRIRSGLVGEGHLSVEDGAFSRRRILRARSTAKKRSLEQRQP